MMPVPMRRTIRGPGSYGSVVEDSGARARGATRPRSTLSIGVPWVLVLLHALALIASGMAGMAMALFGW